MITLVSREKKRAQTLALVTTQVSTYPTHTQLGQKHKTQSVRRLHLTDRRQS